MSTQNKIERYQLGERCLELSVRCANHQEIAERLTQALEGKDSISQPTVSRFLKAERAKRSKQANLIVSHYLAEQLPKDLELLDEVARFHVAIFRGKISGDVRDGKKIEITLSDQRVAARDLHEILKTKFRFVGVPDHPDSGTTPGGDPVDLNQFLSTDEAADGEV